MIFTLLQQFLDPFKKTMDFNNHVFFLVLSQPFSDSSPQGGRKTTQLTNTTNFCHRITTLKISPLRQNNSLNN